MAVLYRKYRPQTFAEVVGQKYVIQTLQNQVALGQVAHAYLFCGTRGVGKTSVARILAKAVNCQSANQPISQSANQIDPLPNPPHKGEGKLQGDACGICGSCKAIEQGNFLDLVEIDAASYTGVDNIRDIIEHVKFAPSIGRQKVFIIDEVHMLSKPAFNALLKTLEEPPRHAIFILATTEIGKVLPTIISRCQRFDFKRLSPEELEAHLEKIAQKESLKLDKAVIKLIAHNAEGSARDSLSLLEKLLTLGDNPKIEECQQLLGITDIAVSEKLFGLIAERRAEDLPEFIENLLEKGLDLQILNRDFLEYLRQALVFKITQGKLRGETAEGAHLEKLRDLCAQISAPEIMLAMRLFLRSYKDLSFAPSPLAPVLLSAIEAAQRGKAEERNKSQPAVQETKNSSLPPAPEAGALSPASDGAVGIQAPNFSLNEQGSEIPAEPAVSLQEIQLAWPAVVAKAKELHSPLGNLLKMAKAQEVLGNAVVLEVKFLFHKQSLENQKNQQVLGQVFLEILGKPLAVRAKVSKAHEENGDKNPVLTDALKIFGGEIIE